VLTTNIKKKLYGFGNNVDRRTIFHVSDAPNSSQSGVQAPGQDSGII